MIVVEHDLSILDYLSEQIFCLFGVPGAYGVVSLPYSVKEGINVFMDGFLPKDNIRFRDEKISFKKQLEQEEDEEGTKKVDEELRISEYPTMVKRYPEFQLQIQQGSFRQSQVVVLLGENGTGKTTFVKILAGLDKEIGKTLPQLKVSYKPQNISAQFSGTV